MISKLDSTLSKLNVKKPKKLIPAILIKEIDKSLDKEEIIEQLSTNEKIKKEEINIKAEFNNSKTKRIIIYLNEHDTRRILDQGRVKMNHFIHLIEPTFKIIQCNNYLKYGHYHKNFNH